MQQRAGRRQPQAVAACLAQRTQAFECGFEVTAPHVAAVDDADREDLRRRQPVLHGGEFFRCAHGIDVQSVDRQSAGALQIVRQRREVDRQQQLGASASQARVSGFESLAPGRRQVEGEDGLVDLHPVDALRVQSRENLGIDGQQAVE